MSFFWDTVYVIRQCDVCDPAEQLTVLILCVYCLRSLTKPFWQMSSSGTVGICTISTLVWYSSPRAVVAPYDDISAGRPADPAAEGGCSGGGNGGGLLTGAGVPTSSSSGGSAHGCFSPDAKMP